MKLIYFVLESNNVDKCVFYGILQILYRYYINKYKQMYVRGVDKYDG